MLTYCSLSSIVLSTAPAITAEQLLRAYSCQGALLVQDFCAMVGRDINLDNYELTVSLSESNAGLTSESQDMVG